MLDSPSIRSRFPILNRTDHGKPLIYLDSAATSLKPQSVIDAITDFYCRYSSNVGRGMHRLTIEATEKFNEARETIGSFVNALPNEIVFVRNSTEAINLVARGLSPQTKVVHADSEHHSNYLPWTHYCAPQIAPTDASGMIDLEQYRRLLMEYQPNLVALSDTTNAFGVRNPIELLIHEARQCGAKILLDASQSVPHRAFDVRKLDVDYVCFSGHKMCGPSGIGILWGRVESLRALSPLMTGGGTVDSVSASSIESAPIPQIFEAGTPNIEGAIGLAAACEFLDQIGIDEIDEHCGQLLDRALVRLATVPSLRLVGPKDRSFRSGSVSWVVEGMDSHTVARVLSDRFNICVRSGYLCAEPAHRAAGVSPTTRASFYLYNTASEVDTLVDALTTIIGQMS